MIFLKNYEQMVDQVLGKNKVQAQSFFSVMIAKYTIYRPRETCHFLIVS